MQQRISDCLAQIPDSTWHNPEVDFTGVEDLNLAKLYLRVYTSMASSPIIQGAFVRSVHVSHGYHLHDPLILLYYP